MRLAVYTDFEYRQLDGVVYGEQAFVLFMCELRTSVDHLLVAGRLDPRPARWHYPLASDIEFVGLDHYETLARPHEAIVALARSLRQFWRALDDVDTVWLLGPFLASVLFAVMAMLRGRRVRLGVRQDLPRYVRSRRPGRRDLMAAAWALEGAFRALALRLPVTVVGPDLAMRYRHAPALLPMAVSLVRGVDLVAPEAALARRPDGELMLLSVGRIDEEKNPLLLADVLARLLERDPRWRLLVAGTGPLLPDLERRLADLGVADRARLLGYVPHAELRELYRSAAAFLHVSWTEGLPQVLFEAFAAAIPVVATAVGGVPAAVADAALLIPPGDAEAAAGALQSLVDDDGLRERLVRAGAERAGEHTLEAEAGRVARFLAAPDSR